MSGTKDIPSDSFRNPMTDAEPALPSGNAAAPRTAPAELPGSDATMRVSPVEIDAPNPFGSFTTSATVDAAASGPGTLVVEKIATTIRELQTSENALVFRLEGRLDRGARAGSRAHNSTTIPTSSRDDLVTWVSTAACANCTLPELARCAVKAISDSELARNEWYHLTTYRSPLFPTPFVFGKYTDVDTGEECHVIVMELIEGPTLQDVIDTGFGEDHGPAPVEKALEIMSPLASSFKALSQSFRGFVHRDIKPANIVVTDGPCRTRLIDLGISTHEQDRLQHRHAGATPGYAPPEILNSAEYPADAPVSYCDQRIDTYALAATLYALLTGHAPRPDEESGRVQVDPYLFRHDEATMDEIRRQARKNIETNHRSTVDDAFLDVMMGPAVVDMDEHLARLIERSLSPLQHERPTPAEFFDELPTKYQSTIADGTWVNYLEFWALHNSPGASELRETLDAMQPKEAREDLPAELEEGLDLVGRRRVGAPKSSEQTAKHADESAGAKAALNLVTLRPERAVELDNTPLSNDYRYEGFLDDFHQAMDLWNAGRYYEAIPLMQKLGDAGDPTAQYNLGICYRDGLGGIVPDPTMKLVCWTKAAEAGNIVAAYNVAVCHEIGDGIPAMPDAAEMWYRRSAEGGFPLAVNWMKAHGLAFDQKAER